MFGKKKYTYYFVYEAVNNGKLSVGYQYRHQPFPIRNQEDMEALKKEVQAFVESREGTKGWQVFIKFITKLPL